MASTDTTQHPRAILQRARDEARAAGSPTVEAEHLLLAIGAQKGSRARRVLEEAGLDQGGIRAALDRERELSLLAAGVSPAGFALPSPTALPERVPRWGESTKLALRRAPKTPLGGHMETTHLLLGVLRAQVGTVPRALAFAGVDRTELAARTEEALSG